MQIPIHPAAHMYCNMRDVGICKCKYLICGFFPSVVEGVLLALIGALPVLHYAL